MSDPDGWTTRWDQIEQGRADAPQEALEEAADLLDEMYEALHVPTRATEVPETEDVVRAREQIEDVVSRLDRDAPVAAEELREAFEDARDTYHLLLTDRLAASGEDAGL